MLLTKAEHTAQSILGIAGIDEVQSLTSIDIKDIIQSRGAFYEEVNMVGTDGRIVTHNERSVISINKSISDAGKKRFTAAHELGHFELHRDLVVKAVTQYDLCNWFQVGSQEREANEFASELLMPTKMFQKECAGKKFGPQLIEHLANTFIVSRTAAILKFAKSGNHPICVVCSQRNAVAWWKMSPDFESAEHEFIPGWVRYKMKVSSRLPPPADSVAGQLMRGSRSGQTVEKFQQIEKSTWFVTRPEHDPKMFEYCNYVPQYDFALSVIWEG